MRWHEWCNRRVDKVLIQCLAIEQGIAGTIFFALQIRILLDSLSINPAK